MDAVDELSKQLARQDTQVQVLHELLQHNAKGLDVSVAAERIVRYCLYSSSGTTPQILSLSLDVLTASPAHAHWVDVLSVIIENMSRSSTSACLTVISKIPSLPHAALQHLVLYASSPLIGALGNDRSAAIRRVAAHAVGTMVLRARPLTALSTEPIRLEHLNEEQTSIVRNNIERLLYALIQAVFDSALEVAATALSLLTNFALESDAATEVSLLDATKHATASAIWDVMIPSAAKIADRFAPAIAKLARGHTDGQPTAPPAERLAVRETIRFRKESVKGIARLAARVFNDKHTDASAQPEQRAENASMNGLNAETARSWSVRWIDTVLAPLCDDSRMEVASCASVTLLMVCCYAVQSPSLEKIAQWGIRAVRRLTRVLSENDGKVSALINSTTVLDATHGLAALSKNDFVTSKFVVATAVGIIPYAVRCPRREVRLEAMSVTASTVVEYDLSGRDSGVGASMKAVMASDAWKAAMESSKKDSTVASEMICCFAQALLESSRKIAACEDANLRLGLTHTWAVMLAHFMSRTHICLRWPRSPASAYARELYLKVFDALGQYSSFMTTVQGVGMEEYERVQEALVKETLEQEDVGTRASLLICVTRYWLTSGMKAESNVGHMLKAVWKHAQEHYRDEEIILKELSTGALWSDARQGLLTPAARARTGGYVSVATAFSKRTKAVINQVGSSVTSAIETTLFGSIALATAAEEGSTLTTDFAYSSLSALLALVSHNPSIAEKGVKLLKKYIGIMEEAESSDFIVLEAVRNTIAAIEMYLDDFFPKPVLPRDLPGISYRSGGAHQGGGDSLAWVKGISESCVFSTSRLEDPALESSTVSTEEAVLHTATATKKRMRAFAVTTLQNVDAKGRQHAEGDQQTLNGASDPFSVVASHSMDTVKGLALLRVDVINRSAFRVTNAALTYTSSGALSPLPDAATWYSLGTMKHGMSVTQRITLSVRSDQGYTGRVFFSIHTWRDGAADSVSQEQSCIPYYIPSSDVLLLRKPAPNAGVDVFRRRWDLMRHSISFHVIVRKDQSVDSFVDTLERQSKCLREVGRMRTYSHVSSLVADSSRGEYVALAGLAPEARGYAGAGPCVIYVTIRSNSEGYNRAFRDECREWLAPGFRVLFLDEDLNERDRALALRPQDAFFIIDSPENLSPYQRWRKAHAERIRY